ncbi:MAG: bifunctional UDP-N-acetylglucosamine diphosphorylase/glucosamine-1-phosphate N-acetyltransferase GlmU [Vulcanibacillus sp.]
MSNIFSIILAAGQGVRMNSELPKVLHEVGGKPMISHVIDGLFDINVRDIVVVVGHKSLEVINYLGSNVNYVKQEEQLGTAHAVLQARDFLFGKKGITIVICGDSPLITSETLKGLIKEHEAKNATATILTAELNLPSGYGRIIRDDKELVLKIVEEKEASLEEKKIKEINSGVYCFDNEKLFDTLPKVSNNNKKGEYYLTDIIGILKSEGELIAAYRTNDPNEIIGVNDRVVLADAERILKERIINKHMLNGVTIIDPSNTYIDKDVQIEADTIIYPNTYLKGKTHIKSNCKIGPGADVTQAIVEKNVTITYSVIVSSTIGENSKIGPFSYIRPGSKVGESVKIGDFVEIKNSSIGRGTKVSHLSYIGDSDLGEEINIGCGTITVNYDGVTKNRINIGDNAFIGCNANLLAPLVIGKRACIAAGSTINDDVGDDTLAIARERQTNKEGYAKKIRDKQQGSSKR